MPSGSRKTAKSLKWSAVDDRDQFRSTTDDDDEQPPVIVKVSSSPIHRSCDRQTPADFKMDAQGSKSSHAIFSDSDAATADRQKQFPQRTKSENLDRTKSENLSGARTSRAAQRVAFLEEQVRQLAKDNRDLKHKLVKRMEDQSKNDLEQYDVLLSKLTDEKHRRKSDVQSIQEEMAALRTKMQESEQEGFHHFEQLLETFAKRHIDVTELPEDAVNRNFNRLEIRIATLERQLAQSKENLQQRDREIERLKLKLKEQAEADFKQYEAMLERSMVHPRSKSPIRNTRSKSPARNSLPAHSHESSLAGSCSSTVTHNVESKSIAQLEAVVKEKDDEIAMLKKQHATDLMADNAQYEELLEKYQALVKPQIPEVRKRFSKAVSDRPTF